MRGREDRRGHVWVPWEQGHRWSPPKPHPCLYNACRSAFVDLWPQRGKKLAQPVGEGAASEGAFVWMGAACPLVITVPGPVERHNEQGQASI